MYSFVFQLFVPLNLVPGPLSACMFTRIHTHVHMNVNNKPKFLHNYSPPQFTLDIRMCWHACTYALTSTTVYVYVIQQFASWICKQMHIYTLLDKIFVLAKLLDFFLRRNKSNINQCSSGSNKMSGGRKRRKRVSRRASCGWESSRCVEYSVLSKWQGNTPLRINHDCFQYSN